jgi:AMP-polyphosphate phosphotransferase
LLEKMELELTVPKEEYKNRLAVLTPRLAALQREMYAKGIPCIILFDGWDAAGKGKLINELILRFDPRRFRVYPMVEDAGVDEKHPFLWRYWQQTPQKGRISVFEKGWYLCGADKVDEIDSFEKTLSDSGCLILKFFLHISKKEQRKRMETIDADPATTWRIRSNEWKRHDRYDKLLKETEVLLEKTDTHFAPWTLVAATDSRYATLLIMETVCAAFENALATRAKPQSELANIIVTPRPASILRETDTTKTLNESNYDKKLKVYGEKLHQMHFRTYEKKIPLLIVFEGWDAAGKGGAIRRLVRQFDPRGYEVIPVSAPNDEERDHHYLWRFWRKIPCAGRVAVFDRSWYGRILVERVEGFCTEAEWRRAYREINEFEEQITGNGAVLLKFWMHIDSEEQLNRFRERECDPTKQWKMTSEDWRNRQKWTEYETAVDEMLLRTSTRLAPWTVVEANSKEYARIKVLDTVTSAMEKALKEH